MVGDEIVDDLMAHVVDRLGYFLAAHDADALLEDDLALVVHHIVELQQVLADVEIARLDLLLGFFERLVDPGMDDRLVLLEAELLQHRIHALGTEDAHEVIIEREIEQRAAGIALAAGTAAQLVVDAPAFMALGADDEEAAGVDDSSLLRSTSARISSSRRVRSGPRASAKFRGDAHLGIAAELDVGAAARHVGGDGDGAGLAGLGDDLRFLLVIARIQHIVRNVHALQHAGEDFRFLDRGGADEDRLSALARILDDGDDRLVFFAGGAIDLVVLVLAGDRHVGRDLDDVEPVDVHELVGFGRGGAGHAGELLVEAEIVLEGDRGERLVLRLDRHMLLGLERLVQSFGIAPARHHAAGELVDDDDLVVLDDVVLVALEQLVGAQPLLHVVHDGDVLGVVELVALEQAGGTEHLLHVLVALFGERHRALLFVEFVIIGRQFGMYTSTVL